MRYAGTTPYPGPTPETRRCRVRNRAGWNVVLPAAEAEKLRPYELFMDKAGRVLVQSLLHRRWVLEVPHTIENPLASASPIVG